jgi:N-acetylneuraminic acid mutarotase
MPTARSEIQAAVVEGRIYVAGGLLTADASRAFEMYDPAADRWRPRATLPVGLHHFGIAALGRRVYVSGGYTDLEFTADNAALWSYDLAADRWSRRADMPAPRAAHAMVALHRRLIVVGGVGPVPRRLWAYDPAADRWTGLDTALPTAREHLAAVALDGKLYVIGGRWHGRGNLSTLEVYDPQTNAWRTGPAMPTPRGGLTAAAAGGRIHVTGGEAFDPGRIFGQHEAFDPRTERWTTLPDLPTPRHGLASAAVGRRWYVIGGATRAGMETFVSLSDRVEIFTPAGD